MTAPFGHLCFRARLFFVLFLLTALLVASVAGFGLPAASAADPRLEEAQRERADIQERLDALNGEIEDTRAAVATKRDELDRLLQARKRQDDTARAARRARRTQARESYMSGSGHTALNLLTADDPTDVLEQARFLSWLSEESQEDVEVATAAVVRADALADHTARVVDELRERESRLSQQQSEVDDLLERAVQAEKAIRERIAKEEAVAARRAASARASRSSGASVPVSGGVACPVGSPRTYIDSWGAARSGGRRHAGTDILAPRGTATPAYESGVISRLSSNSLGGISLYLRGDSGNVYYYTHLSGYAGVSEGQRVQAGQVIAYVGSTGNAGGTNHLHFEVRPGGGGNVNPYPYVRRACG